MIKELSKSIREYKKPAILTPILVTIEVIMECLIPFIVANLVNYINAGDIHMDYIIEQGLLLVGMAIVSLLGGSIAGSTCAKASSGFAKNLRKDIYHKIQEFSFENIDKFSTSSLVTRITTDTNNVQFAFMMIIRTAIRSPLMLIFSMIMAFIMGGKLAFIYVFVVPVLGIGLYFVHSKVGPLFKKVFKKYDNLNNSIQENVKAMRVVKTFVREDYEKEKFGKAAEEVCADFTKAERILAYNGPIMQFCLHCVMIFVLTFGSYTVISTKGLDVNIGEMSAMLTYSFQTLNSLMMLSMVFVMISMSTESAKRIVEVLKEESSLKNCDEPIYEVNDGSIEFRNVNFKYQKDALNYVLSDINLSIKSGETIGILGGTGSSKTSLIQLISRLYDVNEGEVLVGGVDVRNYDLDTLRNNVSVVLQKNVLFSGTIKDNLRWGKLDATEDEMIEVCKIAQVHDYISKFPEGYDKYIEQGGANVSGGQKQRLCIARALLKNPKIIILDDSTSAVDTRTDKLIRESFKKYLPNTTKIIIAQRTSSVQDADKIIVMESGRINQEGTHDELLKTNKIYQEVYYSQNKVGE